MDNVSRREFAMIASTVLAAVTVPWSAPSKAQSEDRMARYLGKALNWSSFRALLLFNGQVVSTGSVTYDEGTHGRVLCSRFSDKCMANELQIVDLYDRIFRRQRLDFPYCPESIIVPILAGEVSYFIEHTTKVFEIGYSNIPGAFYDRGPSTPSGHLHKIVYITHSGTINKIVVEGVTFPMNCKVMVGERWFLSSNPKQRVIGFYPIGPN